MANVFFDVLGTLLSEEEAPAPAPARSAIRCDLVYSHRRYYSHHRAATLMILNSLLYSSILRRYF